jgi:hypothetical protein
MNYTSNSNSRRNLWITIGLITALVVSLAFVAWAYMDSRQDDAPPATVAETATVRTQPPPPPPPKYNCPLDGTEVADKAATLKRPVVVQVDNAPDARPQSGLGQADIVYEAMAEGEITRYSAVFSCHDTAVIGPVRSARLIDLELVPEYKALLSNSGSSEGTTYEIENTPDVPNIVHSNFPDAYWRTDDRYAPHNLMTSTDSIRQAAAAAGHPSQMELIGGPTFKGDTPPAPAAALKSISVPYSSWADVSYQYDPAGNGWLRFIGGEPDIDTLNGKQIMARNVIIQFVPVTETNIIEDAGGDVGLQFGLTGTGKVLIFRDGQVVSGVWKRATRDAITTYYDAQGRPIPLNVGQTWVQVVPPEFQAAWG